MNDRQRIQLAAAAGDRLALLARALDHIGGDGLTVLARIRDAQGPLKGRSYEAPVSSGQPDTPPAGSFRPDRAMADERDLDDALRTATSAVIRAWAIVGSYPPARPASAEDRRRLGLSDGPWCASCARTSTADGQPRREPIRADLVGPTDVGGRLAEPVALCAWCYGCVRDWERLPTVDDVARHHAGQRVMRPA
jgi:hypothetical protein